MDSVKVREGLLEEVGFAYSMEDGEGKEGNKRSCGFRTHGGLNPGCSKGS